MRYVLPSLAASVLFGPFNVSAIAQWKNLTDAQRMDLVGTVKSVSLISTRTDVAWQQPGGPSLVFPALCSECEFDPDGNQIKSGQTLDGSFRGEFTRLVRDANGRVTEHFIEDASTGEMIRHELVGPYGKTEESSYSHGVLQSRVSCNYDQFGHLVARLTLDSDGNQKALTIVHASQDGNDTEEWDWGEDGQVTLHFRQTFDPKTKVEHFTAFNPFGGVNLTWTLIGGELISFWEPPDARSQFGDNFSEDVGNDTFENYDCHGDGTCTLSHIHYVYLDAKRRNPLSVEWRDEAGNLRVASYYKYDIDVYGNWTNRKIRVWSASLGENKLYEIDSRSITYW
ncbi:MAG TPA: hypothetical protein VJO16_04895 [Candidatus Acidoferrum sp.]|nr:hypothetical protein [Candidatus Acidoferrum sp.]